eukprot:4228731-Ditylum_brightwellii.AAC.1
MRKGFRDASIKTPRRKLDMGSVLEKNKSKTSSLHQKNDASLTNATAVSTNKTPMSISSASIGSISGRNDIEFNAHFGPGPIGLKLEPVIKRKDMELGCRVAEFIDSSPTRQSQAKQLGTIKIGDVVLAIDKLSVAGKSYRDIMTMLKRPAPHEGRSIKFRRVQNSPSFQFRSIDGSRTKVKSSIGENESNTPFTLGMKFQNGSAASSLSNKSNLSHNPRYISEKIPSNLPTANLTDDINREKPPKKQTPSNLVHSTTAA